MAGGIVLWPPPWRLTSKWRRAAAVPWLILMSPVFVLGFVAAAAFALISKVTGWGATVCRTPEEVARIIEDFLTGHGDAWDWDDFVSVPIVDPRLESIRARCANLDEEFPPVRTGAYCGEDGISVMRQFICELRTVDG